jgi:hypothetical protein
MRQSILLILAIAVLGLGGCGSPASEVEAPSEEGGEVIAQWAGMGGKTTEPFIIDSDSWAIRWVHLPAVINEQTIGTFQIMVYNVDEPDMPVIIAADSQERETGVFTVEGKGTFYLMINSANSRWLVRVLVTPEESVD